MQSSLLWRLLNNSIKVEDVLHLLTVNDEVPNKIEVLIEFEEGIRKFPRDHILQHWKKSIKTGDLIDFKSALLSTYLEGVVVEAEEYRVKCHRLGWSSEYDTWIRRDDKEGIQPLYSKTSDWRSNLRECQVQIQSYGRLSNSVINAKES